MEKEIKEEIQKLEKQTVGIKVRCLKGTRTFSPSFNPVAETTVVERASSSPIFLPLRAHVANAKIISSYFAFCSAFFFLSERNMEPILQNED